MAVAELELCLLKAGAVAVAIHLRDNTTGTPIKSFLSASAPWDVVSSDGESEIDGPCGASEVAADPERAAGLGECEAFRASPLPPECAATTVPQQDAAEEVVSSSGTMASGTQHDAEATSPVLTEAFGDVSEVQQSVASTAVLEPSSSSGTTLQAMMGMLQQLLAAKGAAPTALKVGAAALLRVCTGPCAAARRCHRYSCRTGSCLCSTV